MQNTQESIRAKLSLLITSGQQRRKVRGTFHLLAWVVFQVDTFCLLECQPTFYICISWFSDINFFLPFLKTFHIFVHHFLLVCFDYFYTKPKVSCSKTRVCRQASSSFTSKCYYRQKHLYAKMQVRMLITV